MDVARRIALRSLEGVGDEFLGQWEEQGRIAFHVRRRLSHAEQIETGLAMEDIRGTFEGIRRAREIVALVPYVRDIALSEMDGRA